jgi:hypothetical protein
LRRKECWALTSLGKILLLLGLAGALLVVVANVHAFLSITHPVGGGILVVEGWLPDYALQEAAKDFEKNGYEILITTGMPISTGSYLSQYKNYAELSAATLRKLGFPEQRLVAVPAPLAASERTYGSALAVKKWLSNSKFETDSVDVCSLGAHARRTWLLYEKALGDKRRVGVIAAEDLDYDPEGWWKSSEGVKTVMSELIAYIYARVFFVTVN